MIFQPKKFAQCSHLFPTKFTWNLIHTKGETYMQFPLNPDSNTGSEIPMENYLLTILNESLDAHSQAK